MTNSPTSNTSVKINIGCGMTPTDGWKNYDGSFSIKLARRPATRWILEKLGRINADQRKFIEFAKSANIQWVDVSKGLPDQNGSVAVIYSCHMVEHLYREDAHTFLKEARRALMPGGVIRIAVPNIAWQVENYLKDGDADEFIRHTKLPRNKPKSTFAILKQLYLGDRDHKWMYDGPSMCRLLAEAGFVDPQVAPSGTTRIESPGQLNLSERDPESVFVEAINP